MQHVKHVGSTSVTGNSVTKIMSAESDFTWVSPPENEVFYLTQDAELPTIVFAFRDEAKSEVKWTWSIEWQAKISGLRERARTGDALRAFNETGAFTSSDRTWVVDFSGKVLGGKLTVTVVVGEKELERTIFIKGKNPSKENIATYISTLDELTGFEKLLEQETRSKHFIDIDGEPITAFDKGYGISQMTNPAPSYEQVWSWKENILGGSSIFKNKVRAAKVYLGQSGRTYTDAQLQHEVFSRWNGGAYHEWDAVTGGGEE